MTAPKAPHSSQEYYYKSIYPVDIIKDASKSANHQELTIRAKCRFLHTSNYSDEKRWINNGETKVPASLFGDGTIVHQRGIYNDC